MRAPRLAALACVTFALAACGRQQAAGEHAAAAAAPATALTPAPPAPPAQAGPAAAIQQKAAGQAAAQPQPVKHMNEDGSETVEDATHDSGTHNPLLVAVASTVAAATPAATAAAAPANLTAPTMWQDGVNYTRIVPAQPTAVAAGQVEVLEFFWYACPHCYAIDPLVESWKKTKPAYISFSRVPVTWSEGHRSLARLFYTLETMGKLDQLHGEIFNEIHVNANPLVAANPDNTAETERMQTAFVKKFGISEAEFKKAYRSFTVENDLQRADELVQRYHIDGVPAFVINGKYLADVRTAGSPERLISLVDDLAAQERKH